MFGLTYEWDACEFPIFESVLRLYGVMYSGWPKFPKDHFQGKFNCCRLRNAYSCLGEPGPSEGNTSHPILLVGNTAGEPTLRRMLFKLSDHDILRPYDTVVGVSVILDDSNKLSKLTHLPSAQRKCPAVSQVQWF